VTIDPSRAPRWGNVDFTDIAAIHIRCTAPRTLPVLPPVLNEATYTDYRHGYINEQALNAATYGFFEHLHLTGRLVINRLTSAYVDHNSKAQFYEKLRAAGFSVRSARAIRTRRRGSWTRSATRWSSRRSGLARPVA
jgi:hypothetical protein